MLPRNISVLVVLFSVLSSCQDSKNWTEVGSIPTSFLGTYKYIDGYEDYRIEVTQTGIYDITAIDGNDLSQSVGIRFYVRNSWNQKRFYRPAIICLNEYCNEYVQIYFRVEDYVLLISDCYPDDLEDPTSIGCGNALKFIKL